MAGRLPHPLQVTRYAAVAAALVVGVAMAHDAIPPAPLEAHAAQVACSPRPAVQTQATENGANIDATLSATGAGNAIVRTEVTQATNARVDVAPDGRSAHISPLVPEDAMTVQLNVTDACGSWPTLVGRGALRFRGPTATPTPAAVSTRGATSTPVPTATRTAVATSTRTATPAQSSPTAIRTATAVPTSSTTQIEGVAVCTDHDPTRYHSLVKRDAQGRIVCTYGHEHKDDPHVLDALFGAPPVQDIDYPWHSFGRYNNPEGHNSFNWAVGQNLPCVPAAGARYGFDNFRLEAHFSVINGDIVRFHSYSLQARGCDPADPTWHGTIQTGGWLDYGQLHIDSPGYPDTIVPLVGVLGQPFPDPNPVVDSSLRRLHGTPDHPRPDATWYGRQGCFDRTCAPGNRAVSFNTGLRAEDWGAFDPANPATIVFYGGEENHSWHEPGHVLDLNLPLDLAVNGRVTYSGFTDRWGNIVPGCTAVGPDCIPLIINNMKPGEYQFRNDALGLGQRDYDVKSPITGKSLIQFPN